MSSTVSDRQKQFIDQIALKEGFESYKADFDLGSLKGDGYMGTITIVKIEETKTKKVLHLILKSAQKGEQFREKTPVCMAYERENFMYQIVHKEFHNIQEEYKVKHLFDGLAKYYGGLHETDEECLVLQNLKEDGFKLWDRKKPMDTHHVAAVMAQYGKFHALSYAMKKLKPEKYSEITGNLCDIFKDKLSEEDMTRSAKTEIEKAMTVLEGNAEAVAALQKFLDMSTSYYKTLTEVDENAVIVHGDCWCNNMMFKYEDLDSPKPTKIYLLDWQLSKLGSPIGDITYFFHVCSSKECFDNYNIYLKIYHDSLSDMLKEFGIQVEEIMTFEELQAQWGKFASLGMYMAIFIIKVMLTEQEEAPDLKQLSEEENNKNMIDFFSFDISNNDEYRNRLTVVMNYMLKNDFI